MKGILTSLAAGVVFGAGLGISGMTKADKVIDFLDLSDAWDPSLALVMGAAVAVHLLFFRFIVKQPGPLFGDAFGIPTRTDIDPRLVAGAGLFGVGWALGGYCPGPGLVSAASGSANALVFVATLTGGMLLYHAMDEAWRGHRVTKAAEVPDPSSGAADSEPEWDAVEARASK